MIVPGNVFFLVLLVLCDQSLTFVNDELMLELYSNYVSAVSRENFTASTRRLFKRNKEYEIHVTKLKEVNGYKKHNLFVKETYRSRGRDPYIYINNPVESKIPKSYLTLEEFKNALIDRVMAQKNEFTKSTKKEIAYHYKNILRQHVDKNRGKETTTTTKETTSTTTTTTTETEKKNSVGKEANTDTIKYFRAGDINDDKDLNKDTTISAQIVSAEKNNVQEKNVTESEKVSENNITVHLVRNVTETLEHLEPEKAQDNPNINTNTTDSTTSHSQTISIAESELLTDTTTVNNSIIVTNIKNESNESFKTKEEPRRKKTTKSFSVSIKQRRSTLGRPLVFFGMR